MRERWYSWGRCAGCRRVIVRRHDFRGDPGSTLTVVCGCSPILEVTKCIIEDGGAMVVWQEKGE